MFKHLKLSTKLISSFVIVALILKKRRGLRDQAG